MSLKVEAFSDRNTHFYCRTHTIHNRNTRSADNNVMIMYDKIKLIFAFYCALYNRNGLKAASL